MLTSVARLEAEPVAVSDVLTMARTNFDEGYRLVTMSVTEREDNQLDIIYHFDLDLAMRHYRLTVTRDTVVPSITGIYFCAVLIENETRDHFGVVFDGLVLDFNGHLYLEKDEIPPYLRGPSCTISTTVK